MNNSHNELVIGSDPRTAPFENAQAHYEIALVYLAMNNRGFATIHYLALTKMNPDLAKNLDAEIQKK